jgi:EmrB/QacA subfamily drug resistance transporter
MSYLKTRPCDEVTIRRASSVSACSGHQKNWVLVAAVIGSTMAFLDESVVNVALPKIETDLGTTLAAMQWVINAYTLSMSALLLIGGAAADQFGRRRMFLTGIAIFAIASLGCGFAHHIEVLLAARVLQGLGAALLIPCSLALIGAAYEEKERGAAIGIWSGASAIAGGAGPLFGGWLVDHWSWHVIFLINPLLAIPALWIALRYLPESRDPDAQRGLDWVGAILAFGGLGSLVYGLIAASSRGWSDAVVVASLFVGVLLLAMFVIAERRGRNPMMPLQLFHSCSFNGINLLTLLLYGALGGSLFFLPFLLIQAHGYSATAAGAVYLPFTLILGVLSRWSGGLVDRFGTRGPLIIGPTIIALGFVLLACISDANHSWVFLLPMVVLGFGMAITVAPLTTAVVNAVPERQIGVASGINNAIASVASLLFVAILGTVAIGAFGRSLDHHMASVNASFEVRVVVASTRQAFAPPAMPANMSDADRNTARLVIAHSYVETIRLVMFIAAALVFASAVSAALTIGSARSKPSPDQDTVKYNGEGRR